MHIWGKNKISKVKEEDSVKYSTAEVFIQLAQLRGTPDHRLILALNITSHNDLTHMCDLPVGIDNHGKHLRRLHILNTGTNSNNETTSNNEAKIFRHI